MSAENIEVIRRGYGAFGRGDVPAVLDILAPDIAWHVPGRGPLSGDHKGHDEVVGFFAATMELSAGTFAIDIDDVLASGQRVVVLCTVSAQRHGRVDEPLRRGRHSRRRAPDPGRRQATDARASAQMAAGRARLWAANPGPAHPRMIPAAHRPGHTTTTREHAVA